MLLTYVVRLDGAVRGRTWGKGTTDVIRRVKTFFLIRLSLNIVSQSPMFRFCKYFFLPLCFNLTPYKISIARSLWDYSIPNLDNVEGEGESYQVPSYLDLNTKVLLKILPSPMLD